MSCTESMGFFALVDFVRIERIPGFCTKRTVSNAYCVNFVGIAGFVYICFIFKGEGNILLLRMTNSSCSFPHWHE